MDNRLTKQLTKKLITPSIDGYHMPGEFDAHEGCVMIWPVRPGSWPNGGAEAKEAFCRIAYAISQSEKVWMLCDHDNANEVRTAFEKIRISNAQILEIETDDAWARDVGPTCVVKKGKNVRGQMIARFVGIFKFDRMDNNVGIWKRVSYYCDMRCLFQYDAI